VRRFNWVSLPPRSGACLIYFWNGTADALSAAFKSGWKLNGPYKSAYQIREANKLYELPSRCFFHKGVCVSTLAPARCAEPAESAATATRHLIPPLDSAVRPQIDRWQCCTHLSCRPMSTCALSTA
jgi:hypothetical protein